MPRSCACARWLSLAITNPAFRLLPDAVQLLWHRLVTLAAAAPERGVLRFEGSVPQSVSQLLNLPETDAETHLRRLAQLGMLEWDAESTALYMPGARAASARAEAARINGLRGGRRRKGETLEQMRARRAQGHLPLPIAGGRAEAAETEAPGSVSLTHDDDKNSNSIISSSPDDALALAREVAEAAGMDPARSAWDAREVQGWLKAGASVALVREVVADVMTRCRQTPRSLRYFTQAIMRALEENRSGPAPAAPEASPVREAKLAWGREFAAHCDRGGKPTAFPGLDSWLAARGFDPALAAA